MVALAPAIAALVAIGGVMLWERRASFSVRLLVATTVAGSGVWSYVLLDRTPGWEPWLRTVVLIAAILAAVGLVAGPLVGPLARRTVILSAVCVGVACFAGPIAYSAQTISTAHTGSLPSAGPTAAGGAGTFGGFPSRAGGGIGPGGGAPTGPGGGAPGAAAGGAGASGPPAGAGALFGSGGAGPRSAGAGGAGGAQVSASLDRLLDQGASRYRWVAATAGSNTAASLELGSGGKPVMAIGGFNNNGGELSLSAFERYVAKGEIHYYVELGAGGGGPGGASGSSTTQIASWVASHFKSETVGGATVYLL